MFDIIFQVLAYAKLLITFSLFTYIYKYFYDSCSEKKVIKSKDNKPKKVIKTRIGLSFLYLVLLILLYFSLSWYIIFTLLMAIFTAIIMLAHKFEPSTLDLIKKYDSNPIIKKIWGFYSIIMNIVFKIMGPFHKVLDNKINKNKEIIKNGVFERVAKMNFNGLNMGFLGNLSTFSDFTTNNSNGTKHNSNKKMMVNDFNNLGDYFKDLKNQSGEKNKLTDKTQEPTSELNKYIKKDSKTNSSKFNSNNTNNEKSNAKIMVTESIDVFNNNNKRDFSTISDVEEPLDTILLNNKKMLNVKPLTIQNNVKDNIVKEDGDNIEDFLNKMKIIEEKVNKNNIIAVDDELSSFVNKNELFNSNNGYNVTSDDENSPYI